MVSGPRCPLKNGMNPAVKKALERERGLEGMRTQYVRPAEPYRLRFVWGDLAPDERDRLFRAFGDLPMSFDWDVEEGQQVLNVETFSKVPGFMKKYLVGGGV